VLLSPCVSVTGTQSLMPLLRPRQAPESLSRCQTRSSRSDVYQAAPQPACYAARRRPPGDSVRPAGTITSRDQKPVTRAKRGLERCVTAGNSSTAANVQFIDSGQESLLVA